jgi:hypothetical protein
MKNIPNYHSTSNRLLLMALAAPPGSIRSHIAAAVVAHSGFFTNDLFRSDPLLSAQIDALLRELAVDFIASPHGELATVISQLRDARDSCDHADSAITRLASQPQSASAPPPQTDEEDPSGSAVA